MYNEDFWYKEVDMVNEVMYDVYDRYYRKRKEDMAYI